MTDTLHSLRDQQVLIILITLVGHPSHEAFRAEWWRIFDTAVECGLRAGWSREVAEDFAGEELACAEALLDSLAPHFVNIAGHC